MIYYIQAHDGGNIKIGKANDPEKRLRDLQVGSPKRLRLLLVEDGDRDEEQAAHFRWCRWQIRGEWFFAAPDLAIYAGGIPCLDEDVLLLAERAYRIGVATGWEEAEASEAARADPCSTRCRVRPLAASTIRGRGCPHRHVGAAVFRGADRHPRRSPSRSD